MGKRKRKSRGDLDRRLEKLEKLLYKRSRRESSTCDEESSSDSRSRSRSPRASRPSRARSGRRKSRRYLSSSPSLPSTDNSDDLVEEMEGGHIEEPVPSGEVAVSGEVATPSLPADIEGLLGLEGAPKVSNGIELHEGLKQRWMAILQNGLTEDTKSSLIEKYDPPKNCGLLVPPKLNAEVAAAMNESGIKRDKRISDQQTVLAAAISAIGARNDCSCHVRVGRNRSSGNQHTDLRSQPRVERGGLRRGTGIRGAWINVAADSGVHIRYTGASR